MRIGIIGLGDMGGLFATEWANLGYEVFGSDLPENFESLTKKFSDKKNIRVYKKPEDFLNNIDFLLFSVETHNLYQTVKSVASFLPKNLIVSAQTSVKCPEIQAFDALLEKSIEIIGSHALFGPHVSPKGQTVVMFPHRNTEKSFEKIRKLFTELGSKIEVLKSHQEHDKLMADVQVVTHIGFESLGSAFMHRKTFPWENSNKVSGLDNIKILLTLRIYSYKAHVYSGLAFQNPYAAADVRKFAKVQNQLFEYMLSGEKTKLFDKLNKAKDEVFLKHNHKPLLENSLLDEFTLNPEAGHLPNSHLSLLSMLCTWHELNASPYENLVCQTPPFRLRVGLVEYLCLNNSLWEETLDAAINLKSIRKDDLAYHTAVHEWANIVELGDQEAYVKHFNKTRKFLEPRLEKGLELSNLLIRKLY